MVDGDFPMVLVVKNPSANAGDIRDTGLIPGSGRCPGGGNGNPLQYSCLENPMDREDWQTTVHRVTKSWTRLKWLSTIPPVKLPLEYKGFRAQCLRVKKVLGLDAISISVKQYLPQNQLLQSVNKWEHFAHNHSGYNIKYSTRSAGRVLFKCTYLNHGAKICIDLN